MKPPAHLSQQAKRIWREVVSGWELDAGSYVLLQISLEAYDRLNAAREQIDAEGTTIVTPTGHLKPHPALRVEKESRSGFLQAWKQLGLESDERQARKSPGRPAALIGI